MSVDVEAPSQGSSWLLGQPEVGGGGGGPPLDVERAPGTSEFRVIVEGLPQSASWQDLKDFAREVTYMDHTATPDYSLLEDILIDCIDL